MPVYITDTDALDRIVHVECAELSDFERERFRAGHLVSDTDTFEGFRAAHASLSPDQRHPDYPVDVGGYRAMYGHHGWNRYFVQGDGEIIFSESHARSNPTAIDLARAQGFTVR